MNNISSYDEVIQLIDAFCEQMKDYEVEYSFTHVVLDGLNLDNETIIRCQTNTEAILNWINDRSGGDPVKTSRYMRVANEIITFLSTLLEVSEEIRDPKRCMVCGVELDQDNELCEICYKYVEE
jgi:hypothetical protein